MFKNALEFLKTEKLKLFTKQNLTLLMLQKRVIKFIVDFQ